jgi:hypothetical protein
VGRALLLVSGQRFTKVPGRVFGNEFAMAKGATPTTNDWFSTVSPPALSPLMPSAWSSPARLLQPPRSFRLRQLAPSKPE